MKFMAIAFSLFVSTTTWAFQNQVWEEGRYLEYQTDLAELDQARLHLPRTADENKILVDALEDLKTDELLSAEQLQALSPVLLSQVWQPTELFRLAHLLPVQPTHLEVLRAAMHQELRRNTNESRRLAAVLLAYAEKWNHLINEQDIELAKELFPEISLQMSAGDKADRTGLALELWSNDFSDVNGVKLFMFCRANRHYPCLFVLKDHAGNAVMEEDGVTLWSQPALGASSQNIPSYQRNGNTPAGVHQIQGVMPSADQNLSFGKFRRFILDYLPAANNEAATRALLPEAVEEDGWWQANVVSRSVGRSLFRIHGTGRINQNTAAPWFPFMRTSGCVAQRENTYGGVEYRDQENLLAVLTRAMKLPVTYENQAKVRGYLFLMEIDDQNAPVTLADLNQIGIQ